jgi:hypothetical protein
MLHPDLKMAALLATQATMAAFNEKPEECASLLRQALDLAEGLETVWPTKSERLAQIRERLAAATPGPCSVGSVKRLVGLNGETREEFFVKFADGSATPTEADIHLRAHAPTDLAWACAEIDRLHMALDNQSKQ